MSEFTKEAALIAEAIHAVEDEFPDFIISFWTALDHYGSTSIVVSVFEVGESEDSEIVVSKGYCRFIEMDELRATSNPALTLYVEACSLGNDLLYGYIPPPGFEESRRQEEGGWGPFD